MSSSLLENNIPPSAASSAIRSLAVRRGEFLNLKDSTLDRNRKRKEVSDIEQQPLQRNMSARNTVLDL
jgi:hypothetical protein